MKVLWLDDMRDPKDTFWFRFFPTYNIDEVVWVKNYVEFTSWITINGLPELICFDHDLGDDIAREKVEKGMSKRQARREKRETLSGHDCAKWLVEYCMSNDIDLPKYISQSANPVGKENILKLLTNYSKFRNSD
jgi:hypothetical protein